MSKAIEGAALLAGAVALSALVLPAGSALIPYALGLELSLAAGGVSMEAGAIAEALTSNRGMNITTRQAAANRQIIYGMQRVGGVIIYKSTTGSHKDQLNYAIIIAGHVCDSLVNLYLDGRQVHWAGGAGNITRNGFNFGGAADGNNHTGPNGQQYNFGGAVYAEARFGDQLEGDVIGGLTANDPLWAEDVNGNSPWVAGCTYIYLKVENNASLFPGEPEVRITVNGKNDIWDPRTHTSGYTANWALVAADMITNAQFGLGDNTVNQPNLIAAANVCDEQVDLASGSTEARYACHWHYDTGTAPGDALAAIMSAAAGSYSQIGGEHYVWPAYWQGPSFSFGPQHLTAPFQWKPYRSVPDRINVVNGVYTAPTFPYNIAGNEYDRNGFYNGQQQDNFSFAFQSTNFPSYAQDTLHGYPSDEWLTADGGRIHPLELSLTSVLSLGQAQRIAKIYLLRNRFQGMGTLEMSLAAYVMQSKNTFDFTFPYLGWNNKVLEVSGASLSVVEDEQSGAQSVRASFNVNETDPSIYEWSIIEELTVYDVPALPSQTPLVPAPPTNMVLTSGPDTAIVQPDGSLVSVIKVTFDTPLDNLAVEIQVQYALTGTGNWLSAPSIDISLNSGLITGVIAGAAYDVRIRSARSTGVASTWVEQDDYVVSTTPSFLGTLGAQLPSVFGFIGKWWRLPVNGAPPTAGGDLPVPPMLTTQGALVNYTLNVAGAVSSYLFASSTPPPPYPDGADGQWIYARFTGSFVCSVSGTHTFGVNSDDGCNVIVNGVTLGSNLAGGQSAGPDLTYTQSGHLSLVAGQTYAIVVEYHNGVGSGALQILYTPPAGAIQLLNLGNAYKNANTLTYSNGTTVQSSQAFSYAGLSESIVPNGSFILGNMEGWANVGFTYGTDSFGVRVHGPVGSSAFTPSFAVVPGAKYRLNFRVYNGSGSGGIYLRIAYQAEYATFVDPNVHITYLDLLQAGSVTGTPTTYAYDWTCPAGMNYASMAIYATGGSDLACQSVSCIPYAGTGEWGADVTGSQSIVYTGASESIVPNGNFLLGNTQGWATAVTVPPAPGAWAYNGAGASGAEIQMPPFGDGAVSPTFSVVPGAKYRITYNASSSGGTQAVYFRICANATYNVNTDVGAGASYQNDFIVNGSLAVNTMQNYAFDWTCPVGLNYASLLFYNWAGSTSSLHVHAVSCVPYAATGQWGADVTGNNTALDTTFVNGVAASSVSPIATLMPTETGADKTLNHVLVTTVSGPIDAPGGGGNPQLATGEPTAYTVAEFSVTANDSSDVFSLQAVIQFIASSGTRVILGSSSALGYVDAPASFGTAPLYGTGQPSTSIYKTFGFASSAIASNAYFTPFTPSSVNMGTATFFGSVTGLVAGPHVISLVFLDYTSTGSLAGSTLLFAHAELTQVSS